jgi:hypothetical protein
MLLTGLKGRADSDIRRPRLALSKIYGYGGGRIIQLITEWSSHDYGG